MVPIVEQIRQVQDPELRYEGFQYPGQDYGHVHRPDLRSFHQLPFAAQLTAGEHIHRDPALGAFLHQFLEPHRRHIRKPVRRPRMTNANRQLRQGIHIGAGGGSSHHGADA